MVGVAASVAEGTGEEERDGMELVAVGLMIVVVIATLRAPGARASLVAVQGALVLVGTIPSFAAPSSMRVSATICIILCSLVALLKAPRGMAWTGVNWALVALMVCVGVNGLRGLPFQSGIYFFGVGCCLALLAAVFPIAARAFGSARVLAPLALMLPIHLALGLAEQTNPTLALWPTGTWMDFLENRHQELLPSLLAGRSMSVAGHPILLGTLAAAGILVAIELFRSSRKGRYLVLAASGIGALALSGTRSAVFAGAVCLVISFLVARRGASRLILSIVLLGAAVIAIQSGFLAYVFNDTVQSGVSYTHRVDVLSSTVDIYQNANSLQLLLGVGDGKATKLFETVINADDNLQMFDNQLVRFFAVSGVLSLVLLAAALVVAFRRADLLTALLLCLSIIMFFSFDTMTWLASAALFAVSASGPRSPTQSSRQAERISAAAVMSPAI
ncbi:hypothetical protein [Sinomonas sp. P47F7]|uniref:hypothetical protein n=1 Tax=Sinomonas sp. P47F7 TaxID=3410987 RepID=UPI003BF4DECD